MVHDRVREVDDLQQRAHRAVLRQTERSETMLANMIGKLETLSPLKVLARGYSITQSPKGDVVRSIRQLEADDEVQVRLSDGRLSAKVLRVDEE
jgi:exodeoxyribonuclease VII large subunit